MSNMFNLKLITISPVHIGCQETLSPYSDYIYKDEKIHIIDEDKLIEFFKSSTNIDNIIDEYMGTIKGQASSSITKRHNLEDFFEKYGLKLEDFTAHSIPCNAVIKQSIDRMTNTSGRPYIPGSTIKGAIRTSLLYHHTLEEGLSEDRIFGKFDKDVLKNLLISDTNPGTIDDLVVLKTVRYNLSKKKADIPVIYESVKKGTEFKFNIKTKEVEDKRFNYLNSDSIATLFEKINKFSKATVERDLRVLESNSTPEINEIVSFYHQLKKEINIAESNNNTAIFRIGRGKTYFDNTIGIGLSDNELKQIIKRMGIGKRKTNPNFFPKTRTAVGDNDIYSQVLGWVKISLD